MKITVEVPKLIEAKDYHDFDQFQRVLQTLHPRLRCKEVGFIERYPPGSTYVGVIYLEGRKPADRTIARMRREEGLEDWTTN